MTIVAGAVVATVASAGIAAPVVTAPALSGIVAGSASAASVAAGTATGGAAAAATETVTVVVGTGTAGVGAASTVIPFFASGPLGLLLLGAEPHSTHPVGDATFDCWKPVVRDGSAQLSSGKLLKEIILDERIKEIIVGESRNKFDLPELRLVNIWDEQFNINYLVLPSNNQLVAHAVRVA